MLCWILDCHTGDCEQWTYCLHLQAQRVRQRRKQHKPAQPGGCLRTTWHYNPEDIILYFVSGGIIMGSEFSLLQSIIFINVTPSILGLCCIYFEVWPLNLLHTLIQSVQEITARLLGKLNWKYIWQSCDMEQWAYAHCTVQANPSYWPDVS
jgi:hypothetical protein